MTFKQMKQYNSNYTYRILSAVTVTTLALLLLVLLPIKAEALSGSEFNAGRIIDNGVFFDSSSMSVSQIQQFLNSKVPNCDTNGTQPYKGTTRAAYGASRGYPAPFTCLKDYSQSIPTKSSDSYCGGTVYGGSKSSSQIIYDVAQACGVSPKVLIVLLQKEQSLITDDWPWSIQYRSATGYGCPDTAPCDAEYYGFFNQVYQGARAYKRYAANPANYNYLAGRNNTILWHPNSGCGTSNVYITNQATAGLYIYTPYRPNQAALNNLYGTGDGCSSYGNRNFWRIFSDWFGSTTTPWINLLNPRIMTTNKETNKVNPYTGEQDQALPAGLTIKFDSKIGGCLRTAHDTTYGIDRCVNIKNLDEYVPSISYLRGGGPEVRKSLQWTCKVNYIRQEQANSCVNAGVNVVFVKKTTVLGKTYLITKHDDERGHTTGFLEYRFEPWVKLLDPRIMTTNKPTHKVNPSTDELVQALPRGQSIKYVSKIGGCLRTETDDRNGVDLCVNIGDLDEFVPNITYLSGGVIDIKKAGQWTCKVDYVRQVTTDQCFGAGTNIVFSQETTALGKNYLITRHDAERGLTTAFLKDRFE